LQGFEQKYPCASWLPVIFQNPPQPPLSWGDFRDSRRTDQIAPVQASRIQASLPQKKLSLKRVCLTAVCVAGSVLGARHLGWLEQSELWAYDRLEVLQPKQSIKDDRIFLIRVTDEDYKAFQEYPIYDQTYANLLSKLQSHQPAVIGFDIYRDIPIPSVPEKKGQSHPISNGRKQLLDVLTKSQNTIALCRVPDIGDSNDFHAPEGVPKENLGFANVPKDSIHPSLNIQRRYFFHMAAKPSCETSSSLGFQVAASYLRQKNIKVFRENTEFTVVGKARFERLGGYDGGYQGEDSGGHRVLINYRRPLEVAANSMTLAEFLNEKNEQTLAHLVKNRIVLIGTDKKDGSDRFLTPYTGQDKYPISVPGIMIHAQMVSYLIDAAEGERQVMWMWKPWGDGLWILGWASVGSSIVYFFQKKTYRIVAACVVVIVVNGVCWAILFIGGWVPLIPTILALLGTEVCLMIYQFSRT
jgi:CHASE2 domain-containing sensor protein